MFKKPEIGERNQFYEVFSNLQKFAVQGSSSVSFRKLFGLLVLNTFEERSVIGRSRNEKKYFVILTYIT